MAPHLISPLSFPPTYPNNIGGKNGFNFVPKILLRNANYVFILTQVILSEKHVQKLKNWGETSSNLRYPVECN